MADAGKSSFPVDVLAPIFLVLTVILIFFFASIRSCYFYKPPPPPQNDARKYISQHYYTVLIEAFTSEAKARQRAEELRDLRINNFILNEWGKWLVCVGKHWNVEATNNTLEALASQGITGEILYPTPP